MKIFAINTVARTDNAPGRIMTQICEAASRQGHDVMIAYGRGLPPKNIKSTHIGGPINVLWHTLRSKLDDAEGMASLGATLNLTREIIRFNPDIVHIHNLHGHYINYYHLLDFLNYEKIPVVMTLHDCWPYTGHCAYYVANNCNQWKSGCKNCVHYGEYPKAFRSNAASNYELKKSVFTSANIVAVSHWLAKEIGQSFLQNNTLTIIPNAVDAFAFRPRDVARERLTILGVANKWEPRKNFNFFVYLAKQLPDADIKIIGDLSLSQLRQCSKNIISLGRIKDPGRLSQIYSSAHVFINASHEETFGMTTIESMACGTPTIVNNTTALPEVIVPQTGIVIDIDNTSAVVDAIKHIAQSPEMRKHCRNHILKNYALKTMTDKYINLYHNILAKE